MLGEEAHVLHTEEGSPPFPPTSPCKPDLGVRVQSLLPLYQAVV